MMRQGQALFVILILAGLTACSATQNTGSGRASLWSSFGDSSSSVAQSEASAAIKLLQSDQLGQSLEASDREAAVEAQQRALRSSRAGFAIAWENDATGRKGRVRPGPLYQVNKMTCREFTHELELDGSYRSLSGTACRQDNGSWQTLS